MDRPIARSIMHKKLITTFAAGVLVLAACGSDSGDDASSTDAGGSANVTDASDGASSTDAGDGGSASGPQAEVADAAIASAKEDGIDLDPDCVNELASQLSDEDAQAIVDAGPDGDAELSDEGTAIGTQLLGCAGNDQIIDALIVELEKSGQEFDEDCVRDGLQDLDLAELAAGAAGEGGTPEEVINAVFSCFTSGT
jgi:hypothetical protein